MEGNTETTFPPARGRRKAAPEAGFRLRRSTALWGTTLSAKVPLGAGDYGQALGFVRQPVLWHAYQDVFDEIPVPDRYRIFRDVWDRADHSHADLHPEALTVVFSTAADDPDHLARRARITALPTNDPTGETLTVYRGHQGHPGDLRRPVTAASWTTDPAAARWFATRFGPGYVLEGRVHRTDVVDAYDPTSHDARATAEREILVIPGRVRDTRVLPGSPA